MAGHGAMDRSFARGDRIVESDDFRMTAGRDVVNDFDLARTDRVDVREQPLVHEFGELAWNTCVERDENAARQIIANHR
jgi:hypothetical protein